MYTEKEQADLKKLGLNIRNMRKEKGFSQESFADYVGLHRTYMGDVELGKRNISVINLLKIVRNLDVGLDELFR